MPRGIKKIKEIEHIVTEQEIIDNNLGEVLEVGDVIGIPVLNTRECTCGSQINVSLLQEGEVIGCSCGVKHSL